MNFLKRLQFLFTGAKTFSRIVPNWLSGQAIYPEASFDNNVRLGYKKNELIYACVRKRAETARQVHLVVKSKETKEPVDENHPLYSILKRPNSEMTESDMWTAVISYQMLAGRAVFAKIRNKVGDVIELWPLRPDWTHPVADSTMAGFTEFSYEQPGAEPIEIPREDIIDFKIFDPTNIYHSFPPVSIAGRVADVDNHATDYIKLFWEKGGLPPFYIKTQETLADEDVERLRKGLRKKFGGFEQWTEPMVLDKGGDFGKAGFSFEEMGFGVLDKRSEARICMVLDVPPMLVGAVLGLERAIEANAAEFHRAWWHDSLMPLYEDLKNKISAQLVDEYPDVYVEWDFSNVPALQDDINKVWDRATEAFEAGAITRNEFREVVGLQKLGPEGDVFVIGTEGGMLVTPVNIEDAEAKIIGAQVTDAKYVENAPKSDENEEAIVQACTEYFDGFGKRIQAVLEDLDIGDIDASE